MRNHILLFPNSMTLTVYLCLHVTSALLLLLLCFSASCLGTLYETCRSDNQTCGNVGFGYPFGTFVGCGDPDFQLRSCDSDDHPLLNIGGNEYHILEPYFLGINSNPTMTIVNDNLWGTKCNLSGNYSQFWSASNFHISSDTYTNLTLWGHCNGSVHKETYPSHWSLCEDDWYYFPPESPDLTSYCLTPLKLPFKTILIEDLMNQTLPIDQTVLQGFQITWQVDTNRYNSCADCLKSNGICGYNIAEPRTFLCHCSDGTSPPDKCRSDSQPHSHSGNTKFIVIGCIIGGVVIAAMLLTYYAKRRKTHDNRSFPTYFSKYERNDMEEIVLPERPIGNLPIFSYEELRQATGSFNEKNEIGDGGFGSVYLGKLRDGRTVAIKRLYQDNSRRLQQFINEVEIFSSLNHPYVVRLYGCTSANSPELLLVYEYVSNGTLADHLHGDRKGPKGLPWDTRLNIAIQIAQALAFLHSVDPPIFHRDVKSNNILLDEKFNVKVADFGLCRLLPVNATHVTTAPQGTPGYLDPEYHELFQLTEKSDVYSFGVVLVEIISAKLAVDISRKRGEINLAFMAISKIQEGALHEILDPQLEVEKNDQVKVMVSAVAELIFRCLALGGDDRPHMKEVVAQLEQIRDASPTPCEQWESFPNMKTAFSPTSVQDRWPSRSSNSDNSA